MQNDQAWPKPYPIEELCKENECPPYTVIPLPQGEIPPPNTAARKISGGIGGGGQRRGSIYWGGGDTVFGETSNLNGRASVRFYHLTILY